MKLDKTVKNNIFPIHDEVRPWGYYGLYSDNRMCTTKILYIRGGEMLSLQYHFKRDQEYILLDDSFVIEYSSVPIPDDVLNDPNEDRRIKAFNIFLNENIIRVSGNEGDIFGFSKKTIHRAIYNGTREYGRILDLAWGWNDEEDIVRIQDKYGRT